MLCPPYKDHPDHQKIIRFSPLFLTIIVHTFSKIHHFLIKIKRIKSMTYKDICGIFHFFKRYTSNSCGS